MNWRAKLPHSEIKENGNHGSVKEKQKGRASSKVKDMFEYSCKDRGTKNEAKHENLHENK